MRHFQLVGALLLAATSAACGSDDGATPSPGGVSGAGGSGGGAAGSAGSVSGMAGAAAGAGGVGGGGAGGTAGANMGGAPADCTNAPTSLFCLPLGPMPASIKGTGLFPALPDLNQHPSNMLAYAPDPALWSDGMEKQRFLVLPAGQKVDNTDRKKWAFPEGTLFVKTFLDDTGPAGASRPIETRLIRLAANATYEFYVYQWNADSTDAALVVDDLNGDINADIGVMVSINHMSNGKPLTINGGMPFEHKLPSRNACGECHEKNGMVAQTFIGFDELRLNTKLTADAAKTQLQTFADAGIFTLPAPTDPATITDASADEGRLLRIKRFVFGNCVTCHNGESQFDLHPDVFVSNTVGKPTEAQSVMPPPGWLRVVPGDAATSVLYVQMQRTMLPPEMDGKRLRAMPPIGLSDLAVEQDALKDVLDWITALPTP